MTDFEVRHDEKSKWRLDIEHHEIHAGNHYVACLEDESQTDGNTIIMAFKTPNTTKWIHLFLGWATKAGGHVEILEAPTWTRTSQTLVNVINSNRNAGNVSGLLENITQTDFNANSKIIGTLGDLQSLVNTTTIYKDFVFSSFGLVGEAKMGAEEFVLKQDTAYVIRYTADGASNAGFLTLHWYEHQIID